MNRREFVLSSAAATTAINTVAAAPSKPPLCIFSKHMAHLDWAALGAKAKEMGFDAIDLTVRPKGHVLPEKVAEDLPRALGAIRKAGCDVAMVTTDLKSADDPAAKPTFETMKKLGLKLYKVGYWRYKPAGSVGQTVEQTVEQCRALFKPLVDLGNSYGVVAGLHNHSGDHFGCAMWDLREVLKGTTAAQAGYYFDPGHATIEGGAYGWRASLDLALSRLKMSAIKDFYWDKRDGKWRIAWCPLGQGMVNWPEIFKAYAKAGFTGPLSLHVEYGKDSLDDIARDLAFMKAEVAKAYA
jgi:sugar phosphate isomerase/epimerase